MKLLQFCWTTIRFNLPIASSVSALTWLNKDSRTRILPGWCSLGLRIAIDYQKSSDFLPTRSAKQLRAWTNRLTPGSNIVGVPSLWLRLPREATWSKDAGHAKSFNVFNAAASLQQWWQWYSTINTFNYHSMLTTMLWHAGTKQCRGT